MNFLDNKKQNIYYYIYLFSILGITYSFLSNLLFYYRVNSIFFNHLLVNPIIFSINILVVFLINKNIIKYSTTSKILLFSTLLCFSSLFSSLLNNHYYTNTLSVFSIQSIWWSFLILTVFCAKSQLNFFKTIIIFSIIPFLYIFFRYYYTLRFTTQFINSSNQASFAVNSIYYLIMFIPFILEIRKSHIKNIMILFIFLCVLISLKRTAFISLVLSILGYYYIELFHKNKRKKKTIFVFAFLVLIILLFFSYYYILNKLDLDILNRINSLQYDEGSGRLTIYKDVIQAIKNTSFIYLIFGFGSNGVFFSGASNFSAHNDFLEVIYDFGFVGFTFYFSFIISLFRLFYKSFKLKLEFSSSLFSSLIIFSVMSMFSHLIHTPSFFVYLTIYWGLCIIRYDEYTKNLLSGTTMQINKLTNL